MTIVVQYAIWEHQYKKTTLIQIRLTCLTKKGEDMPVIGEIKFVRSQI